MNLAQNVERAAKFFPDRAAIMFEGTTWTYGDLNARANRLANALKANGVTRGDRVVLYLPNCPEFALCYLAVIKVGAVAVSVNALYKSEELKYILNDSGAVAIFTPSDLVPNIPRAECPALKHVIVVSGDGDYVPLVEYLRNQGKQVEMAAFGGTTSAKLIEAADDFLDLSLEKEKFLIYDRRYRPTPVKR